jgi:tRNA (guanine6-N2)-methyltransferase
MPQNQPNLYEVTVVRGLESMAHQELRQRLGKHLRLIRPAEEEAGSGALQFKFRGNPTRLLQLNTISNSFAVCGYDIPRPKALCDQQNFTDLALRIQSLVSLYPRRTFRNFGISAAGADSSVMQRLAQMLRKELGIPFVEDEIDLLLRIRPSRLKENGWEVLIRMSPRPLSLRAWRVADMPGALFAPVANCMVRMTRPRPSDSFLNIGCGSGTLLIERLIDAQARRVIGCDINPDALAFARENLTAAQLQHFVELHDWDARRLNLSDSSIDAICADLPYGIAVGSHDDNIALYPALLEEAARVAKPGASMVLITQEAKLLSSVVRESTAWRQLDEIRIALRGMHPRIFILERSG